MKKVLFYILCMLLIAVSFEAQAGTKSYKGSNVYSGKKFKGHKCPPKRKIINAKYF